MSDAARASLVIPAHNEESVVARCLTSVVRSTTRPDTIEVVVVANGCDDATATVARGFADRLPGLRVLERTEPGKIGALNAGDELATAFPRVYLDADVELSDGALDALVALLDTDQARVGSPGVHFDLDGCGVGVRAFYRVFQALPYANDALIGLGVYGLSATGRRRFGTFPDVTADDLFVDRLFGPAERVRSAGSFTVRAPRSLPALLAVRTRVARGNAELARTGRSPTTPSAAGSTTSLDPAPSTGSTVSALVGLVVHRPLAVLDVLTYVAVTAWSRLRARRASPAWLRDDSTR